MSLTLTDHLANHIPTYRPWPPSQNVLAKIIFIFGPTVITQGQDGLYTFYLDIAVVWTVALSCVPEPLLSNALLLIPAAHLSVLKFHCGSLLRENISRASCSHS